MLENGLPAEPLLARSQVRCWLALELDLARCGVCSQLWHHFMRLDLTPTLKPDSLSTLPHLSPTRQFALARLRACKCRRALQAAQRRLPVQPAPHSLQPPSSAQFRLTRSSWTLRTPSIRSTSTAATRCHSTTSVGVFQCPAHRCMPRMQKCNGSAHDTIANPHHSYPLLAPHFQNHQGISTRALRRFGHCLAQVHATTTRWPRMAMLGEPSLYSLSQLSSGHHSNPFLNHHLSLSSLPLLSAGMHTCPRSPTASRASRRLWTRPLSRPQPSTAR